METEWTLLNDIMKLRERTKCTKFVGALTIERLREEFVKSGLNVSNRDVFIESIPYELDLLISEANPHAEANLVYDPEDVLAVLEVKFRGSYGKKNIEHVKKVFKSIEATNSKIECLYVSISENKRYKYRITRENLGHDCFELLTRESNLESALRKHKIAATGDWQKLLSRLKNLKSM